MRENPMYSQDQSTLRWVRTDQPSASTYTPISPKLEIMCGMNLRWKHCSPWRNTRTCEKTLQTIHSLAIVLIAQCMGGSASNVLSPLSSFHCVMNRCQPQCGLCPSTFPLIVCPGVFPVILCRSGHRLSYAGLNCEGIIWSKSTFCM